MLQLTLYAAATVVLPIWFIAYRTFFSFKAKTNNISQFFFNTDNFVEKANFDFGDHSYTVSQYAIWFSMNSWKKDVKILIFQYKEPVLKDTGEIMKIFCRHFKKDYGEIMNRLKELYLEQYTS